LKLSCPGCGAEMTIDVLIAHEGAREAVLAALQLPAPLGKLLVQYLAMFRPPKRQLSWERVSSLLEELRAPIAAAEVKRHGRTWPAPIEYWKAALEQMVQLRDQAKLQLPLKSHGYLLEVIAGMSGKAEAKAESAQEIRRAGQAAHKPASFALAKREEPKPVPPIPDEIRRKYVKGAASE
jgi:hypothetical protein